MKDQRSQGGQWVSLGTYDFDGLDGVEEKVELVQSANGYVIADAIKFAEAPPEPVVPIGGIIPWAKDIIGVPSLPNGFVEYNGQTLDDPDSPLNGQVIPDLNGTTDEDKRFLRGSTTSGGTGGAATADPRSAYFNDQTWVAVPTPAPSAAANISIVAPYYYRKVR